MRVAGRMTLVIVVVAALTACTTPVPVVEEGIAVSLYQPRTDVAGGRIAIQVSNGSTRQFTVSGATLTSTFFEGDLVWHGDRDVRMPPGRTVDLRVQLGESACADPADARHLVTLTFELDGQQHTRQFVPADPFGLLPRLNDAACLRQRVAEVATLTAESLVPPAEHGAPATLIVAVRPTGRGEGIVVDAVQSTTLLAPAENGLKVAELEVGVTITSEGPARLTLPLVPNRCDAHALAEDKVGTRIPLIVTTADGTTGRLLLEASDALREQMYGFYASYCELG